MEGIEPSKERVLNPQAVPFAIIPHAQISSHQDYLGPPHRGGFWLNYTRKWLNRRVLSRVSPSNARAFYTKLRLNKWSRRQDSNLHNLVSKTSRQPLASHLVKWSGRWDLNPRNFASKANRRPDCHHILKNGSQGRFRPCVVTINSRAFCC